MIAISRPRVGLRVIQHWGDVERLGVGSAWGGGFPNDSSAFLALETTTFLTLKMGQRTQLSNALFFYLGDKVIGVPRLKV